MEKVILVTGGFDPIHQGHIAYLESAKQLGDVLVVGMNSDAWLTRKKGRPFMTLSERTAVMKNLCPVDDVIHFDDSDGSAKKAIYMVRQSYPQHQIIFANGGDRTEKNSPEMDINDPNLEFVFGVGGVDKANSSSWILEEWKAPKTVRAWGHYRVLHEPNQNVKLKELTVEPGHRLSMQRHDHRGEFWFVSQGAATVYTINSSTDADLLGIYSVHQHVFIPQGSWHQLCNEAAEPLKLIEIQYGDRCEESDIERSAT